MRLGQAHPCVHTPEAGKTAWKSCCDDSDEETLKIKMFLREETKSYRNDGVPRGDGDAKPANRRGSEILVWPRSHQRTEFRRVRLLSHGHMKSYTFTIGKPSSPSSNPPPGSVPFSFLLYLFFLPIIRQLLSASPSLTCAT